MRNFPELWREMERPFAGFFHEPVRQFSAHVDVEETSDGYKLTFDVPGIAKDALDIEVRGNQLIVAGERKEEASDEKRRGVHIERTHGSFSRSFVLPENVRTETIEARHQDGVLTVFVPKARDSKPTKVKIDDRKGKADVLSS